MIVTPQLKEHHEALTRVAQGRTIETRKPKNAFKYPKAPDAVFPQHEIMKPVDFRSQNLPMAGYAFRGNRRKYNEEETEYMHGVATNHPPLEILAGGGGTQRGDIGIIKQRKAKEAQGAMDVSDEGVPQLSGSSSSSTAVKAESAEPPEAVDNKRPPVKKDGLRSKRLAEKRPRAKTKASVKTKV